jgi:hypothetical protein
MSVSGRDRMTGPSGFGAPLHRALIDLHAHEID